MSQSTGFQAASTPHAADDAVSRKPPEGSGEAEPLHADFMVPGQEEEVRGFVLGHNLATYCHHPGWEAVLREAYGRQTRFLLLRNARGDLAGVVPAADVSSRFFGRQWVCLPYLDYGGPLAVGPLAESALVEALMRRAGRLACRLEIRSNFELASRGSPPPNEKSGMTLFLDGLSEETYWKSLDARVRNQVRKAEKSGVTVRVGGRDQLDGFYPVFCRNSRDLGSPVHSRRFFESLLEHIPSCEIATAWREGRCIGGLVRIRFRDTLAIPWAATLKRERVYCPNNALYYDGIRAAIREGLSKVDFGRSTRGEGTFRYKAQWLARPTPLAWYQFDPSGNPIESVTHLKDSGGLRLVSSLWSRMPLFLANRLGPRLRPLLAA